MKLLFKKLGVRSGIPTHAHIRGQTKSTQSEQASSLMRSMQVANYSLHNDKDRNAILPTKGHTKETKQREERGKTTTKNKNNIQGGT